MLADYEAGTPLDVLTTGPIFEGATPWTCIGLGGRLGGASLPTLAHCARVLVTAAVGARYRIAIAIFLWLMCE